MDVRSIPYPADFPVISTPGMFTGWTLTVEMDGEVHNVIIDRHMDARMVADELHKLADKISL